MEIQKVGKTNVKIKSKNVSFVTNTFASGESIPLFFSPSEESSDSFFIEGPGEYEVSGVRVKGTREGEGVMYEVSDDPITLFVVNTPALKSLKGVDEGTILLVENNGEITNDELSALDAYLTIVYGEPVAESSYPEIEKVNLRKLEETKGIVVLK
jgi:hypothetical protein